MCWIFHSSFMSWPCQRSVENPDQIRVGFSITHKTKPSISHLTQHKYHNAHTAKDTICDITVENPTQISCRIFHSSFHELTMSEISGKSRPDPCWIFHHLTKPNHQYHTSHTTSTTHITSPNHPICEITVENPTWDLCVGFSIHLSMS